MTKYLFGSYLLDVDERRLLRDNEEIRLRGKLFDTLRVLVENAGKLVRKDAFMESVWPDSVVEDNNLDYCIRAGTWRRPAVCKCARALRWESPTAFSESICRKLSCGSKPEAQSVPQTTINTGLADSPGSAIAFFPVRYLTFLGHGPSIRAREVVST